MEHNTSQPITDRRSSGGYLNLYFFVICCAKGENVFFFVLHTTSVTGASITAAKLLLWGRKDFIQPPGAGKVNAHVAHGGLDEPRGIVNKVKAPERKLIRGYEGGPAAETMLRRQEALSGNRSV